MGTKSWLAAALVAAAATTAGAGDLEAGKGPWEGFGVGSSYTMKSTTTSSMAGMPATSTETKQTLVKVTDEAWTVKTEMKSGEMDLPAQEMTIPRKATGTEDPNAPKPVVEELGKEKVTVDGQDYECVKTKTVSGGNTMVTWTHEKHGTLKYEGALASGNSSSMVVTKLAKKATVAGKELECRESKMTTKMAGMETEVVMLQCEAIPGRMARMESTTKMGAMTTTSVTETVAFEVK